MKTRNDRICVVSRLMGPDTERGDRERIIGKLKASRGDVKYIVLDDYSREYLLLVYVVSTCRDIIDRSVSEMGLSDTSKLVSILYDLKDKQDRIREIERTLKKMFDEQLYEEYQYLLSRRDKLLPLISRYWESYRELFDELMECINRSPLGGSDVVKDVMYNWDKFSEIHRFVKSMMLRNIGYVEPGISIIWISGVIYERKPEIADSLGEKVKGLINHMVRNSCSKIVLVDGEEYMLLKRYLKLEKLHVV